MADDFDMDVWVPDEGTLDQTIREAMFKAAVRALDKWKTNLEKGQGALGAHGRHRASGPSPAPFVDRGEAVNSLVVEPQTVDADEWVVGGEPPQLRMAETGLGPGVFPPLKPLVEWIERKGIEPDDGDVEGFAFAIAMGINLQGIPGFAPGLKASREVQRDLPDQVVADIKADLEAWVATGDQ